MVRVSCVRGLSSGADIPNHLVGTIEEKKITEGFYLKMGMEYQKSQKEQLGKAWAEFISRDGTNIDD